MENNIFFHYLKKYSLTNILVKFLFPFLFAFLFSSMFCFADFLRREEQSTESDEFYWVLKK